jgi:hypothetical protein
MMNCIRCGIVIEGKPGTALCPSCFDTVKKSKNLMGSVWLVDYKGTSKRFEQCPLFSGDESWAKDLDVEEGLFAEGVKCGKITSNDDACGLDCPFCPSTLEEEKQFQKNRSSFFKKKITGFWGVKDTSGSK